jgi:hypothetical protein
MAEPANRNVMMEHWLTEKDVVRRIGEQAFIELQRKYLEPGRCPSEVQVSYYNRLLQPGQAPVDVLGERERLLGLRSDSPSILLLIDPWPHANWGHACWIATIDLSTEKEKIQEHLFPPNEDADCRQVPFAIYRANGEVQYLIDVFGEQRELITKP